MPGGVPGGSRLALALTLTLSLSLTLTLTLSLSLTLTSHLSPLTAHLSPFTLTLTSGGRACAALGEGSAKHLAKLREALRAEEFARRCQARSGLL